MTRPCNGCTFCRDAFHKREDWRCFYTIHPNFLGDEWWPWRSKMAVVVFPMGDQSQIHIHAANDEVWRQEPYYSQIKLWAANGLNQDLGYVYVFLVDERSFLILPTKEVEVTGKHHAVVWSPQNEWDAIVFDNEAEAHLGVKAINTWERPNVLS